MVESSTGPAEGLDSHTAEMHAERPVKRMRPEHEAMDGAMPPAAGALPASVGNGLNNRALRSVLKGKPSPWMVLTTSDNAGRSIQQSLHTLWLLPCMQKSASLPSHDCIRPSLPTPATLSQAASCRAVFVVRTDFNFAQPWQMRPQRSASGSAFVMDARKRHIMTNAHVVRLQLNARRRWCPSCHQGSWNGPLPAHAACKLQGLCSHSVPAGRPCSPSMWA